MDPVTSVTLYWFACDVTGTRRVILASSDYEAVRERRDSISAAAARTEKGICTEPHTIHHTVVNLVGI